jgi:hypothetical protein
VPETPTAPPLLAARLLVRVGVVWDAVFYGVMFAWVVHENDFRALIVGLVFAGPTLVFDAGIVSLDVDDLRRRTIFAVVTASLAAVALATGRLPKLAPYVGVFVALNVYMGVVAGRSIRIAKRYRPVHRGGGGTARKQIAEATKTSEAGMTSGWVGRRRFF